MNVRRERNEMLRILSEKKKRAFYEQHLGSTKQVLWEPCKQEDMMNGFTDNYVKVQAPLRSDQIGKVEQVTLNGIEENSLVSISY